MQEELLEIIDRVKKGEKDACHDLFKRYKDRIYYICMGIMEASSLAADVTQEAFIKMFRSMGKLKNPEKFYTWFCRLTINLALDKKRKVKRENIVPLEEWHAYDSSHKDNLEKEEIRKRVHKALNTLPDKFMSALILREMDNLSYNEISNVLKCSIGTVRSRISRARNLLKEKLRET